MTDVELVPLVCMIASIFLIIVAPLVAALGEYTYDNPEQRSLFEIYVGHYIAQFCVIFILGFVLHMTLNVIKHCGIIPHCRKFCNRNKEQCILPYEGNSE